MKSHDTKTSDHFDPANQHTTRRTFLGTTAVGGAALLSGGLATLSEATASAAKTFPWSEVTIPQLQAAMASGGLTSKELTLGYLNRIALLNPLLHAVIETNPNAVSVAAQLDKERRRGSVRGPLHGIPILVKDNIATRRSGDGNNNNQHNDEGNHSDDDAAGANGNMQTTAGSLALVNSDVPADAPIVRRLKAAGAIILGKANLGEWANWRGFNPLGFYGWSARGGATHNPYLLSYTSYGSSSGSGVAAAANLCAAAIGTETDGSVVGPSNANLVVGLKPTLGLVSQSGIIPISHSQDTAGPMGRTVTDVAILLGVLQSPFGPVSGHSLPRDYTRFLQRGALKGARIGVDRRYFNQFDTYGFPGDNDTLPFAEQALHAMLGLGATLVDTDTGDFFAYFNDELTALMFEFKVQIADYLAGLTHTTMRTLADLIAFNIAHCAEELAFYGQEVFESSEATSGNLNDPTYLAARANARHMARTGIDSALARDHLDAIVAPHLANTTAAAVSGYPNIGLPVGITPGGKPAGILMYSTFLHEPQLLAFAYDLEQHLHARVQPQFLGAVSDPPNAGLCSSLPKKSSAFTPSEHQAHRRIF